MVDRRYIYDWEQYKLIDGVLYKKATINNEETRSLQEDIFKAYHDDFGHQGRDRTLSLLKLRYFLPGLDQFVRRRIQCCSSCIRRKTAPV